MSTQKIVVFLFLFGGAGVAYQLVNPTEPVRPPNQRVNERNFERLRAGMSSDQVENILGQADSTGIGTLLQVQQPDSPNLQCTIEPAAAGDRGDVIRIYQGQNDESIRTLFSAKGEKLTAAEYRVSNYPVIYCGPRTSKHSRSYTAVTTGRLDGPEETRKRQANVTRYQRRKALAKRDGGSFFSSSSETLPDSSTPDNAPLEPRIRPAQTIDKAPVTAADLANQHRPEERVRLPPAKPLVTTTVLKRSGPFRIELPSKKVLSDSAPSFSPPAQWQQKFFPPKADVYVAKQGSQGVQGVFAYSKSKLHGASVTLYDNGRLETIAFYRDGKLHGPARSWTDQRQRILYAEYKNGSKHGLICLYRGEKPWLVQEWNNAKLKHEYLVNYESDMPAILSTSDINGTSDDLKQAQRQLNELEEKMRAGHARIRIELTDWIRKQDQNIKQRRVTEAAAGRRPSLDAADRIQSVESETLWRAALGKATN